MMRTRRLALVFCVAAALAVAPAVFANHGGGGKSRNKLVRVAPDMGSNEAASIVRPRTGGKVRHVRTAQRGGKKPGNNLPQSAPDVGPDEAAAIVRSHTGGKVLGVRTAQRGGKILHRVKVLKGGYVRTYKVDARSGNILE